MVATRLVLRPTPTLYLSAATAAFPIRRRLFFTLSLLSGQSPTLKIRPSSLYGPSLLKGSKVVLKNPKIIDSGYNDDVGVIDEERFTRVFDVLAIRVPAKDSFMLEKRLRGHLLNWPRIRNIARVPGDDVDEGFEDLVVKDEEEERVRLDKLNRRVYGRADGDGERLSSVLYRDKLVKSFDANGFVNFRNVAKMSRPGKRKKDVRNGIREVDGKVKRIGDERNGVSMVEVVEDVDAGNWSGLLGVGFVGRVRWRGPTRLLLLDESYANRDVEQLPEAIKVSVMLPFLI